MGLLWCSNNSLQSYDLIHPLTTDSYCVVKSSTEYNINQRLFASKMEMKNINNFYPVAVQYNFQLEPCAAFRGRFVRGAIDGLFISFNVVALRGWIAFLKSTGLWCIHTCCRDTKSTRTPGTAAGRKGKTITPTVLIISLWHCNDKSA